MLARIALYDWARNWIQRMKQTLRLMVGVPDYDTYVRHQKLKHPDQPVLSYKEFFRQAQLRRYEGGGTGRCC